MRAGGSPPCCSLVRRGNSRCLQHPAPTGRLDQSPHFTLDVRIVNGVLPHRSSQATLHQRYVVERVAFCQLGPFNWLSVILHEVRPIDNLVSDKIALQLRHLATVGPGRVCVSLALRSCLLTLILTFIDFNSHLSRLPPSLLHLRSLVDATGDCLPLG